MDEEEELVQDEEVVDQPEVAEEPEQEDDDADVIVIEGEEPEEEPEEEDHKEAPKWVKEVRERNKELKKRVKELEAKVIQPVQVQAPTVGPKPTLESCDYDADKFEAKLDEWKETKRKADEVANRAKAEQEAIENEWKAKLAGYEKAKSSLRVKDFADAEEVVKETLSVAQQSILVSGAKVPADLIYALGKRPKLVKELAEIKNAAEFAMELGRLEGKLRKETREKPEPEKVVRTGSGTGTVVVSKAALEKELDKARASGDYNRVMELKRRLNK